MGTGRGLRKGTEKHLRTVGRFAAWGMVITQRSGVCMSQHSPGRRPPQARCIVHLLSLNKAVKKKKLPMAPISPQIKARVHKGPPPLTSSVGPLLSLPLLPNQATLNRFLFHRLFRFLRAFALCSLLGALPQLFRGPFLLDLCVLAPAWCPPPRPCPGPCHPAYFLLGAHTSVINLHLCLESVWLFECWDLVCLLTAVTGPSAQVCVSRH